MRMIIFILKKTLMKRVKDIYKILPLLFSLLCLYACDDNEIKDIEKVHEFLELTASSADIALDENNLTEDIITFKWTEARQMSDDYVVSYTTKLDLVGNNFGSGTAILTYEDDGVFSRSFTSEQLNNWANEKWKLKVNQPFTLEFRVVAEWTGGPTFEAPEVRTVRVNVTPIKVEVFEADNMFIAGSAVNDTGEKVQMTKTVENESQYAWYGNLEAGELQIPVELNGDTYYIIPTDGEGTLQDGEAESVKMQEAPISWNIPADGEYRIVVNMEKATITIYSPARALQPAVVQWMLDGVMQTTTVEKLWRYGSDGWAWKEINFVPSLADPQIFTYSGAAINGRTKFGVHPVNVSYVYTGNSAGQDTPVTHGNSYDLVGGYGGGGSSPTNERNSYFSIPSGTNFIILDIRNSKAFFDKR